MAGKNTTVSGAVRAEDFYELGLLLSERSIDMTMSRYIDFAVQIALALGSEGILKMKLAGPKGVAEALKTALA